MTSISARLRNSFCFSMLLIGVAHADPNGFTLSTINPTGSTAATAGGVNNIGQIVGGESLTSGAQNGFLSSGGTFTTFDASQGSMAGSYAEGINNNGQIVGLNLASGTGFLLSGGTFTTIAVPGSDNGTTNAIGINDSGQIVGTFQQSGVPYGFLLSGGNYTTIAAPGATATAATGINNSGQIVGWFTSSGVTSGFSLSGGNYTTLTSPGSTSTKAHGINNNGQIVGEYSSGGVISSFLLQGGSFTTLSAPGSTQATALGINDAGQIVGSYLSSGTTFGFSAAQNTVAISFNSYALPVAWTTTPGSSGSYRSMGIAAGPDNALWFTEQSNAPFAVLTAIGRISTAGVVSEYPLPSSFATDGMYAVPTQIAAGADGALWFTSQGNCFPVCHGSGPDDNIGRITTSGLITTFPLPAGNSFPNGIAAGPDGAIWFAEEGDEIGRITTSGVLTEFPLSNSPNQIAAGPDGALWFTQNGADPIGRITTSGLITGFPAPSAGGIVAGPDGALWFTESAKIGRITSSGVVTEYAIPTPQFSPGAITAGPDGALWFTEAPNKIGRITTSGAITEYLLPTSNPRPSGIAAGPDGGIWFAESGESSIGQIVIATNAPPPMLSVTITHTGNFTQSQTNQTYTVTVLNQAGAQSTVGTITLMETLPPGLSLVSMAGTGWTCSATTCSRGDSLTGGASYPAITVTVNVASNATSPQLNQVSVQNGGSAAANASDSTTIIPFVPSLSVTKTHTGSFTPGQSNAAYTVTVSNGGAAPTNGTVTVTDTLPSGLTLVSMAGVPPCTATSCSGWTCALNSCVRSDSLAAGASYPAITVTVNVAANAASLVNSVSVSGGGSASANATDSTIIGPPPHPPFFNGEQDLGSGVYYLTFPNGTLFGAYTYLQGSFLYHYDMGFEYMIPANDVTNDAYFFDFTSGHWWFTGPALFPNIYDFTLGAWIFYIVDSASPGHYTANPRKFAYDTTHVTFTM